MVPDFFRHRQIVSPDIPHDAIERRGGDHVDLADVGIGRLGPVIGHDAIEQQVVTLLGDARGNLQDRHITAPRGAGHPVAITVFFVGTDGRLVKPQ